MNLEPLSQEDTTMSQFQPVYPTPTSDGRFPVTEKALVGRVNRKLAPEFQALRTLRGKGFLGTLGRRYIVNLRNNTIVASHVDVEQLARELGVIDDHEALIIEN